MNALRATSAGVRDHYAELARMWDKLADERLLFFVEQPGGSGARFPGSAPSADECPKHSRCATSDD